MESSKISVKKVEEIWPMTEDFPTKRQQVPQTLRDELLAARRRLEDAKSLLLKPSRDLTDAGRGLICRIDEMLAEIDKLLKDQGVVQK